VAVWVDEYRRFWDESFDRLDAYLKEIKARATQNPETSIKEPQK